MQCIKMASTLRISSKCEKPSPRMVKREGMQEDRILDFLKKRRKAKSIITNMIQQTWTLHTDIQ